MKAYKQLRLALIGHGQAANSLYHALADLPEVYFQWVIGRRLEGAARFAREHHIPHYGIKIEPVLEDPRVDAVLICTPNDLHVSQALLALEAGKHVVVEVPLAMSYPDAQTLVRTATAKERFLSVPHVGRYLTTVQRARAALADGTLGFIYQLVYRRLVPLRSGKGWTGRPRMWIDSVSWHQGAHAVDLVYWLLNEPLTCVGAAIGYHASHDQSTDVSATFVAPAATIATVTISYNAPHKVFDCVLVGEKSLLELQDFTTLRLDGVELVREIDPFDSLERAYRRYALELVAGLREEGAVPVEGGELLPVMEQLDRMHALAAGQMSR